MMRFFAFLKQVFAVDRAYQVLTEVLYDAIKEIYIPALEEQAEKTKNVANREVIYTLIGQYKKYANPQVAEGRELLEVAARVVGSEANRYRDSGVVAEDVVQQIAGGFYTNPRMEKSLKDFNPMDGPIGLRNYWSRILWYEAKNQFRQAENKVIRRDRGQTDEEGNELEPYHNVADPQHQDTEDLLKGMLEYIPKNFHKFVNPANKFEGVIAMEIYDILKKDIHKIGEYFKKGDDVYPIWKKINERAGRTTAKGSFGLGWKVIKNTIHKYLSDIAAERKRQMAAGKTAAERVAREIYRVRMAKWILGKIA